MKSRKACKGKNNLGADVLLALPDEILCQMIKHLDFQDKIQLQFVCRKLNALLMSPPPGEGLWGKCDLSTDFNGAEEDESNDSIMRRWLLKRVPYMTRISYDTASSENAEWMLHTLIPSLSHLIAPAAGLCINPDEIYTERLLQCSAHEQPELAVIDFWHTLSDRLKELSFDVDWDYGGNCLLQPQLLEPLTALTKMCFHVTKDHRQQYVSDGDTLGLPELKVLRAEEYSSRHLDLECPKLTSLTLADCSQGLVSLQAPLQELLAGTSHAFKMHPGFPMSNLMQLVSLSIKCHADDEMQLFHALPLMQKLQTLDLGINEGSLLQGLPHSLCEVNLHYTRAEGWDNAVIPELQQLSNLEKLQIIMEEGDSTAALSSDLKPFMGMQKLFTLRLGPWELWTPGTFKALGQLEVELMKSNSKLKLIY